MSLVLSVIVVFCIAIIVWFHLRLKKIESEAAELAEAAIEERQVLQECVTVQGLRSVLQRDIVPSILRRAQLISDEGDQIVVDNVLDFLQGAGIEVPQLDCDDREDSGYDEHAKPSSKEEMSGLRRRPLKVRQRYHQESALEGPPAEWVEDDELFLEQCQPGAQDRDRYEEENDNATYSECGPTAVEGMQEVLSNVAQLFGQMGGRHEVNIRAGDVRAARVIVTSPPPSFLSGLIGGNVEGTTASIEEVIDSGTEDVL